MNQQNMPKILQYIKDEEYDRKGFIRDHVYYDNWDGECEDCGDCVTDEDKCLVIIKKDLEPRRSGTTKKVPGELIFCSKCYPQLLNKLFG